MLQKSYHNKYKCHYTKKAILKPQKLIPTRSTFVSYLTNGLFEKSVKRKRRIIQPKWNKLHERIPQLLTSCKKKEETHAQRVQMQMQIILFTKKAWWWNLLAWRKQAQELLQCSKKWSSLPWRPISFLRSKSRFLTGFYSVRWQYCTLKLLVTFLRTIFGRRQCCSQRI